MRARASASIVRARQPVVPFDRLIRVGRGAERHQLARPRRPIELARQHLDEVALHQNHRRELVVGIHFELDVIAAREAVVAAVGAAAVGVERPAEGHPLDAVQRGAAGDLLIPRGIGAALGVGQRGGAALPDQVRDLAGRWVSGAEIKQKGMGRHIRHSRIVLSSPIMRTRGGRVKPCDAASTAAGRRRRRLAAPSRRRGRAPLRLRLTVFFRSSPARRDARRVTRAMAGRSRRPGRFGHRAERQYRHDGHEQSLQRLTSHLIILPQRGDVTARRRT